MHRRSDDQIARRLQISGHTLYMNEITLLRHALEQGRAGVFTGPFAARRVAGSQ
jgi:hypothetical protein